MLHNPQIGIQKKIPPERPVMMMGSTRSGSTCIFKVKRWNCCHEQKTFSNNMCPSQRMTGRFGWGGFNSWKWIWPQNILSMFDIPLTSLGMITLPTWFRTWTFVDMLTTMGFCTSTLWNRWNSGNQTLVQARLWSLIEFAFHIDVCWCFCTEHVWFAHLGWNSWGGVMWEVPIWATYNFEINVNQLWRSWRGKRWWINQLLMLMLKRLNVQARGNDQAENALAESAADDAEQNPLTRHLLHQMR